VVQVAAITLAGMLAETPVMVVETPIIKVTWQASQPAAV
jgi:hypothetical protein